MTQTTLKNKSIYELAEYVKDDLQSSTLNKKCVKITYTRPSYSSLISGQSAICIRKGDNGNGVYDYHFMKLFSGDTWRHKPGRTAILTVVNAMQSVNNIDRLQEKSGISSSAQKNPMA